MKIYIFLLSMLFSFPAYSEVISLDCNMVINDLMTWGRDNEERKKGDTKTIPIDIDMEGGTATVDTGRIEGKRAYRVGTDNEKEYLQILPTEIKLGPPGVYLGGDRSKWKISRESLEARYSFILDGYLSLWWRGTCEVVKREKPKTKF